MGSALVQGFMRRTGLAADLDDPGSERQLVEILEGQG
jgi:hypothetical protein